MPRKFVSCSLEVNLAPEILLLRFKIIFQYYFRGRAGIKYSGPLLFEWAKSVGLSLSVNEEYEFIISIFNVVIVR